MSAPSLPHSAPPASASGASCSPGTAPHGRDLPWRRTSDPYHILVSEMMLQQTQVDRVLPKYHEWLDKYPSLEALAAARGRRRRARRGGRSATTSGRGGCTRSRANRSRATAASCRRTRRRCSRSRASAPTRPGAIRSFAFGQRAAILDTNVARVLFRVFVGRGDAKAHAMRKQLWAVSEALVPAQARLRLQPGADGSRRDGLHRAKAEMRCVPDDALVHVVSEDGRLTRRLRPDRDRRRRGGDRRGRRVPGDAAAGGRPPRRPVGVSRRQDRPRAKRMPPRWRARSARSSTPTSTSAISSSTSRTPTTTGRWRCTSIAARCGERRGRCSARRCGGCRAPSWRRSAFRPADEELIKLLTESPAR